MLAEVWRVMGWMALILSGVGALGLVANGSPEGAGMLPYLALGFLSGMFMLSIAAVINAINANTRAIEKLHDEDKAS